MSAAGGSCWGAKYHQKNVNGARLGSRCYRRLLLLWGCTNDGAEAGTQAAPTARGVIWLPYAPSTRPLNWKSMFALRVLRLGASTSIRAWTASKVVGRCKMPVLDRVLVGWSVPKIAHVSGASNRFHQPMGSSVLRRLMDAGMDNAMLARHRRPAPTIVKWNVLRVRVAATEMQF